MRCERLAGVPDTIQNSPHDESKLHDAGREHRMIIFSCMYVKYENRRTCHPRAAARWKSLTFSEVAENAAGRGVWKGGDTPDDKQVLGNQGTRRRRARRHWVRVPLLNRKGVNARLRSAGRARLILEAKGKAAVGFRRVHHEPGRRGRSGSRWTGPF